MQNKVTGIIGAKGTGKTQLAVNMTVEVERLVIFDAAADDLWLLTADQVVVGSPREAIETMRLLPKFRLCYRPIIWNGDECPSLDWLVAASFHAGHTTLVIDEAHLVCQALTLPRSLMIAVRLGRHRYLDIIYVAQSFSAISKVLTQNTNEFIIFKNDEPRQLDTMEDRFGREAVKYIRRLRKLDIEAKRGGEALIWNDTGAIQIMDTANRKLRVISSTKSFNFEPEEKGDEKKNETFDCAPSGEDDPNEEDNSTYSSDFIGSN